jgi:hypothetical protein
MKSLYNSKFLSREKGKLNLTRQLGTFYHTLNFNFDERI